MEIIDKSRPPLGLFDPARVFDGRWCNPVGHDAGPLCASAFSRGAESWWLPVHARSRIGRSNARRHRVVDPSGAAAARRVAGCRSSRCQCNGSSLPTSGCARWSGGARCWRYPSLVTRCTWKFWSEAGTLVWYQFGPVASKPDRPNTHSAPRRSVDPLSFAFVSCQHFAQGFYSAHKQLAEEDLDFGVHLGDYIYEGAATSAIVRPHLPAHEIITLDDYRIRYALYKSDPRCRRCTRRVRGS